VPTVSPVDTKRHQYPGFLPLVEDRQCWYGFADRFLGFLALR